MASVYARPSEAAAAQTDRRQQPTSVRLGESVPTSRPAVQHAPGGRNSALNRAAWTLGHWVAAGALDQREVEDALYAAALANGLVADDGERQWWATIRSGLGAGLQEPIDLDAQGRAPRRRRAP